MFYVYAYLDPRKPGKFEYGNYCFLFEPFYIGKGSGDRLNDHLKSNYLIKNGIKSNKIKSISSDGLSPYIVKVEENILNEDLAYKIEEKIINIIGRITTNNGPLTNLKEGGKGGLVGYVYTEEQLKLKSEAAKMAQSSLEYKERRRKIAKKIYEDEDIKLKHKQNTIKGLTREAIDRGKRWLLDQEKKEIMINKLKKSLFESKEERSITQQESWKDIELLKRHSDIMREISNRPDVKKKIRESNIKKVYQYTKDGVFIKLWESVSDASKELNISPSAISNNCRGLSKKSNGFIWSYVEIVKD